MALTMLAYPLCVQLQAQGLPERGAWRRVPPKWNCTWPLPRVQSDASVEQCLRKELTARNAACSDGRPCCF
jgi:hypothetical protein